jgi:HlyD family secretion protein
MPKAQCDIAKAQVAGAETAVNAAQNRFEQAKAGATAEQLVQVEAAVKVAEQQVALAKQPATENDLRQVRAAVSGAEAQLALVKQPVTEFDLKSARAGVDQAKAAVELAKVQLTETVVKAPFDGVVSARMTSEGAIVGPTAPLLTLISVENEVVINVDEANLGKVQRGQAATVEVTAYPGTSFKAKVTNIAPSVDARSRTTVVKLVAEDTDGKLRDGMFAQVRLAVAGN